MKQNKCPYKYKYQLVEWSVEYFHSPKSHFTKMSKKQLYALWYNAEEASKQWNDIVENEVFVVYGEEIFNPRIKIGNDEYIDVNTKTIIHGAEKLKLTNPTGKLRLVKPKELYTRWKIPTHAFNDFIKFIVKKTCRKGSK